MELMFAKSVHCEQWVNLPRKPHLYKRLRGEQWIRRKSARVIYSQSRWRTGTSHRSCSNYEYISSWEIRPRLHGVSFAAARCQAGTLTTPTTLYTVPFGNGVEIHPRFVRLSPRHDVKLLHVIETKATNCRQFVSYKCTELNWFYWAHLQPWGVELLNKLYNNTMIQTIKND